MAIVLAKRGYVSWESPACFGPRFKQSLLADPSVVNLQDRTPYFYELGLKLALVCVLSLSVWRLNSVVLTQGPGS